MQGLQFHAQGHVTAPSTMEKRTWERATICQLPQEDNSDQKHTTESNGNRKRTRLISGIAAMHMGQDQLEIHILRH